MKDGNVCSCGCRCCGDRKHGMHWRKHGWHRKACGGFWFVGWMFTLGFLKLAFWKGIAALIVWPYFIGSWAGGLMR